MNILKTNFNWQEMAIADVLHAYIAKNLQIPTRHLNMHTMEENG